MAADTSGITGSPMHVDAVLSALRAVMGPTELPASARICAMPDAKSTDEGLALLGAYVAIQSPAARQAILDAVLLISRRDASAG